VWYGALTFSRRVYLDRLRELIGQDREEIEKALKLAYEELGEVREREAELLQVIADAERMIGGEPESRLTLHEAMAQVLREGGNQWMHTRDLASEVNTRGLYRKRDGSPVESNQIHARAKNYEDLFEKDRQMVRLREGDRAVRTPRPRSKYDTLRRRLEESGREVVRLSFDEIESIVGGLPRSAWDHRAWWANEEAGSHVQTQGWMPAGYRVDGVDQRAGRVVFRREVSRSD
jgi:hypothetical protein